jgi:hypothetical protein
MVLFAHHAYPFTSGMRDRLEMRVTSFLLVLFTVSLIGEATAAFAVAPTEIERSSITSEYQDDRALIPSPDSGCDCHMTGEEAEIREQDTSNPCLAADAAPGAACFDRFGFGMLRARRALLPDSERKQCRN